MLAVSPPTRFSLGAPVHGVASSVADWLAVWTPQTLAILSTSETCEAVARLDVAAADVAPNAALSIAWQQGGPGPRIPGENVVHSLALCSPGQVLCVSFTEVFARKAGWLSWLVSSEPVEGARAPVRRRPLQYTLHVAGSQTAPAGVTHTAMCALPWGVLVARSDGSLAALDWEGREVGAALAHDLRAGAGAKTASAAASVIIALSSDGPEVLATFHDGAVVAFAVAARGAAAASVAGSEPGPVELAIDASAASLVVPPPAISIRGGSTGGGATVAACIALPDQSVVAAVASAAGRIDVIVGERTSAGGRIAWRPLSAIVHAGEGDSPGMSALSWGKPPALALAPAAAVPPGSLRLSAETPSGHLRVWAVPLHGGVPPTLLHTLAPHAAAPQPGGLAPAAAAPAGPLRPRLAWGGGDQALFAVGAEGEDFLRLPLVSFVGEAGGGGGSSVYGGGEACGSPFAVTSHGVFYLGAPPGTASAAAAAVEDGAATLSAATLSLASPVPAKKKSKRGGAGAEDAAPAAAAAPGPAAIVAAPDSVARAEDAEQRPVGWLAAPPPAHYLPTNAPLLCAAASPDGNALAVAGPQGAATFHASRRQWRVFPTERQECAVAARALTWLGASTLLILADPVDPETGRPVPTASGVPTRLVLHAYPRAYLDVSMRLCAAPLPVPSSGSRPVAMATGMTTVMLDASAGAGSGGIVLWLAVAFNGILPAGAASARRAGVALYRLKLLKHAVSATDDAAASQTAVAASVVEATEAGFAELAAAAPPTACGSDGARLGGAASSPWPEVGLAPTPAPAHTAEDPDDVRQVRAIRVLRDAAGAAGYSVAVDDAPAFPIVGLEPRLVGFYLLPPTWAGGADLARLSVLGRAVRFGADVLSGGPVPAAGGAGTPAAWEAAAPQLLLQSSAGAVAVVDVQSRCFTRLDGATDADGPVVAHASPAGLWWSGGKVPPLGQAAGCVAMLHSPVASSLYAPATHVVAPPPLPAAASDASTPTPAAAPPPQLPASRSSAATQLTPSRRASPSAGSSPHPQQQRLQQQQPHAIEHAAAPEHWPGVLFSGAPLRPGVASAASAPPQILGVLPRHGMALALAHAGAVVTTADAAPQAATAAPLSSEATGGSKAKRAAAAAAAAEAEAAAAAAAAAPPRLLPPGVRVLPTLQLLLRAALLQGLFGPAPPLGSDPAADPLEPALRIAQHAAAAGTPLVLSALRALLYEAVDDAAAPPAPGAAPAPSLQRLELLARVQVLRDHRRVGEGAHAQLGPGAAAPAAQLPLQVSPQLAVELSAAVSPSALAQLRALAEAVGQYLDARRLPAAAVFGAAAAAPAASSAAAAAPAPPATTAYLEAVLALLARLDLLLDVVATVGRTVEEAHLPLLFPAAGRPKALLHECLRRAADASAALATPSDAAAAAAAVTHSRASLRFLHLAGAYLLLSQDDAWRARSRPGPGHTLLPPSAADVAAIVAENLADARALLEICGLPHATAAHLTTGGGGAGAAELDLDALLAGVSNADPLTAPTLRRVVDSTAEYCSRLHGAATAPQLQRGSARGRQGAASGVIAGGGGSSSGGVRGLVGSFASYFGFVDGGEDDADGGAAGGVRPAAGGARAVASDPIVALLRSATLPVLVPFTTILARKPAAATGGGGGFGLLLRELEPAGAAGTPAPPPPAADAAALQRCGLSLSEAEAVRSAVAGVQAQQAGWVVAQVRDAAAQVDAAEAPLTVQGAAARAPPVVPAAGDILVGADGQGLAGRDFSQVVDALVAAPRESAFALLRVQQVPVLAVLGAILAGSGPAAGPRV